MVQSMGSKNLRFDSKPAPHRRKVAPENLEEQHGPPNKLCKPSSPSQQQWNASKSNVVVPSDSPSQCSILDEPGPLGLRLRKSPSLVELIQMKLSQETNAKNQNINSRVKKPVKTNAAPAAAASSDSSIKYKASNFPATLLRIGSWEYKSKYGGALVAKFYYAKNRLVWEVIEGQLKRKIEIQWSDIMALKAHCPANGPSSLTLVLAKRPCFSRETDPQPKKHTQWQITSDFTDGQASIHRLHFLQCAQGQLTRHFQKLIQCDTRLNFLSQQPEIILGSPHFDGQFKIEQIVPPGIPLDSVPCEASSTSSGMDSLATEGNSSSDTNSTGPRNLDQIKVPGLRRSMSVSDFIGHVEHCLSEEMTSGNPSFSARRPEYQEMLEDIAQHLLNDNQVTEASSDEKSLMSRVNSLCCLLQKDPLAVQNPHDKASAVEAPEDGKNVQGSHDHGPMQDNRIEIDVEAADEDLRDVSDGKLAPGLSRKDSFTDLVLNLPRIASLPKLLFDISEEDSEIEAR